ncbi:MAG: hypothetical protein KME10_23530 [Plectolyngbya sp. WJT66-NPBG17]|jgi:hypothetical protein|nr:hypothetical protein [Plectolyngbya sp. WJT66-NPBG17]
MLRTSLVSASVILVLSSIALFPSVSRAETYQECINDAAAARQQYLASGASRTEADAVYTALVRQCNARFGR